MYFDVNGPDFIRVQQLSSTKKSDSLDPDVFFTGDYDDGMCFKKTATLTSSGLNGDNQTFDLTSLGLTRPGIIFASMRLTADCVQNGETVLRAGEIVPTQGYSYYKSSNPNPGQKYRHGFWVNHTDTSVTLSTLGYTGVATALILDVA